jgi:hypothetical protein
VLLAVVLVGDVVLVVVLADVVLAGVLLPVPLLADVLLVVVRAGAGSGLAARTTREMTNARSCGW